jgi:hypothetical protein
MFAKWRYDGPQREGHYADFFGFEPDIRNATAWDGPLYQAGSGADSGIPVTLSAALAYVQQGTPFQYHIGLETPSGKKEAVFSFTLTKNGTVYNLSAISAQAPTP